MNEKTHLIFMSDLLEENGKTVMENNLEKEHKYPIGEIVEVTMGFGIGWSCDGIVKDDEGKEICLGLKEGTVVLYVVDHQRDCDGTPLYSLSDLKCKYPSYAKTFSEEWKCYRSFCNHFYHGIGEEDLKPVGHRITLYNTFQEYMGF